MAAVLEDIYEDAAGTAFGLSVGWLRGDIVGVSNALTGLDPDEARDVVAVFTAALPRLLLGVAAEAGLDTDQTARAVEGTLAGLLLEVPADE